jgi:DNA invertase Pin-like site-specific DNA recombinase
MVFINIENESVIPFMVMGELYTGPSIDLQTDALKKAGCLRIYSDHLDGPTVKRPELDRMVTALQKGDVVVTWKLDRLSGNFRDLFNLLRDF